MGAEALDCLFFTAEDVMRLCGTSRSGAYDIINEIGGSHVRGRKKVLRSKFFAWVESNTEQGWQTSSNEPGATSGTRASRNQAAASGKFLRAAPTSRPRGRAQNTSSENPSIRPTQPGTKRRSKESLETSPGVAAESGEPRQQ